MRYRTATASSKEHTTRSARSKLRKTVLTIHAKSRSNIPYGISWSKRFLGYDIRVRRSQKHKRTNKGFTKRTLCNTVELNIPFKDKIEKFLFKIRAVQIKNGALFPQKRTSLITLTDLEIVTTYNAELHPLSFRNQICMICLIPMVNAFLGTSEISENKRALSSMVFSVKSTTCVSLPNGVLGSLNAICPLLPKPNN